MGGHHKMELRVRSNSKSSSQSLDTSHNWQTTNLALNLADRAKRDPWSATVWFSQKIKTNQRPRRKTNIPDLGALVVGREKLLFSFSLALPSATSLFVGGRLQARWLPADITSVHLSPAGTTLTLNPAPPFWSSPVPSLHLKSVFFFFSPHLLLKAHETFL